MNSEKPSRELVLFTSQIEYQCLEISKSEFIDFNESGVLNDTYVEFQDSMDYCEPVYDEITTLLLDDVELKEFNTFMESEFTKYLDSKSLKEAPIKPKEDSIAYAVAGEKWYKRSLYKMRITENFDAKKLKVTFYRNFHFDGSFRDTFTLFYYEQQFEFAESYDSNVDIEYLTSSIGQRFDFTVSD